MNTQELIEKYEDKLKDIQLKFGVNFKTKVYEVLVEDLRQLYEPQKVQVPQFVADWYEEHNIVETQLILGKQVLEIVFDLLKSNSKTGVVLPLNINGRDFTITVEKEEEENE